MRIMTTLRSWGAMGKWPFVLRLAAVGAFAGFAAWALAFALYLIFGSIKPSALALLLAVPRGALFGVVFALVLWLYWNRGRGRDDSTERF